MTSDSSQAIDARVRAAAAGDARAVRALLSELLPRSRNLVRYLVRGDADVDDIAQEALVAVLRGLPTYRADGSFRAWSDRITARVTFAYLKRTRSRREVELPDLSLVADPGAPPDEYAIRRQTVRMLDRLPDDQRQVLVLHHVMGMSLPEVAGELCVPLETARSRLRLAKQKLRALRGEP
ncbi:MAG: RNA polymerase sigma factor [Myxococcales bacterium]|nr:RNA polymerase sigma factor [Myxococcales bacterium]